MHKSGKQSFHVQSQWKFLVLIFILFLAGCASSHFSRSAANNVDSTYDNISSLGDDADHDSSIPHLYQNASQTTKGALIGGAAGTIGAAIAGVSLLPGAAGGAVLGGTIGSLIDRNGTLLDHLANRGVNVIVLGDQVLIVIPSAFIFNDSTATLHPAAYSTLDAVARYIRRYTTESIKVAAYTNAAGSSSVSRALSKQQAESVARYLEKQGINTRLLYAVGYGGTHLVEPNSQGWDSDNYRIEISFEKLPVAEKVEC